MYALIDGDPGAVVDVRDRGLMYGDGVFRTMLSVRGAVRNWARQMRKLTNDCAALGIRCPATAILEEEVARVAAAHDEAVVKVVVTRGSGTRGYAPVHCDPRRIVLAYQRTAVSRSIECGVEARWCTLRLSAQPATAGVKHLNRLENVLARGEWDDPAIAEGLLQDREGNVIGGTMSNLFIDEGGILSTPDLSTSGVAGVQRERLMEAATRAGVPCRVEPICVERVRQSDALFVVNSVIGLWRVGRLGDRSWPFEPRVARYADWLAADD